MLCKHIAAPALDLFSEYEKLIQSIAEFESDHNEHGNQSIVSSIYLTVWKSLSMNLLVTSSTILIESFFSGLKSKDWFISSSRLWFFFFFDNYNNCINIGNLQTRIASILKKILRGIDCSVSSKLSRKVVTALDQCFTKLIVRGLKSWNDKASCLPYDDVVRLFSRDKTTHSYFFLSDQIAVPPHVKVSI